MKRAGHSVSKLFLAGFVATLCWLSSDSYGARRYAPGTDYFPEKIVVRYAGNFRVVYGKNYKVVTTQPKDLQQNRGMQTTFVLVQRGTPVPPLSGELARATVIEIPVRTAGVWLNEDAALLELLGVADRIIVTGPRSRYRELQPGYKSGRVRSMGPMLNFEVLLECHPELVIALDAIESHETTLQQLRALGVKVVGQYSWLEANPLGRAEWVKFASLFFNREHEAEALFFEVERTYRKLADEARQVPDRPSAFWATPSRGSWSCSRDDWEAHLLEAAGSRNVLSDRGPSRVVTLSDEFIVNTVSNADVWITLDAGELGHGHSWEHFKSFRSGRVYDPYKPVSISGAPEFSGIAGYRPDLMLKDLVSILHPEAIPGYETVFFQRKGRDKGR